MMVSKKNSAQKLKEKLQDITFSEIPDKKDSSFDVKKFEKRAKKVRNTFKNEDSIRPQVNI